MKTTNKNKNNKQKTTDYGLRTTILFLLTAILLSATKLTAGIIIDEKFTTWPPENWQIVDYTGNGVWTNHYALHGFNAYIHKNDYPTNHNDVALASAKHVNDYLDSNVVFSTSLITPPLDLSGIEYVVLNYDTVFHYSEFCSNYANVDVSTNSGSSWITILNWTGESHQKYGPGTNITLNISVAGGCPDALVRFFYYSDEDYYWEIDNVEIAAGTVNPTDFVAKGATKSQINLSWMTNEIGDGVIIARNLSDSFGIPTDGTVYNVGNNVGSSSVIYKGNEIEHSDSDFIMEATEYFYKIWSVNSLTQYSEGVTAKAVSCVATFPYMESFETDFGIWREVKNNTFDWTRRSGATPTGNTGPSGAFEGNYYIYTDIKGGLYYNKSFLIDASFDFSDSLNPEMEFFYHMYGSAIGSLQVEVLDESGVWHTNLFEKIGEQQTSSDAPWKPAILDLQKFGEQSPVKVRFIGNSSNDYYGDIAVDYITITNRPNNLYFTPKTLGNIGHPGTTVQYNINVLNVTTTNLDFDLTYTGFGGGSGWTESGPANTGVINFRNSTNFTLTVNIDPNAAANAAHTSVITSVSVDGIFTNSTEIITICDWHYEIYFEDFNAALHMQGGWPCGWTNYFLGSVGEGWFHGKDKHDLLWAPTHDPIYTSGVSNWFVSPAIDFSSGFDQIYLSFFFLHYSDPYVPMEHKQSVYISTGSRNPNDGDFVKISDIDYGGNVEWHYNNFDLSAFHGFSNVYIAIDYTSGNPTIAFDLVNIEGNRTRVKNAKLNSPTSFSLDAYQTAPAVTGSIYIAGNTGTNGPDMLVTAQFGYGLKDSNPLNNLNWKWNNAVYSFSDDNYDFYVCNSAFPTVSGDLDCAFRFKNGESSWIYADTTGSSNGYSTSAAGEMIVNMLPPDGELVKKQTLPTYIIDAYKSIDNTLDDYIFADDFQFTSDTDINSIRWEATYGGSGRTGYETGIVLRIYQNNPASGGFPGTELYSEFFPGYSCEQFVKKDDGYDMNILKYHVDLATTFEAAANTKYWVGLQMLVPVQEELWGPLVTTDSVSGQPGASADHGVWTLRDKDIGFELYGETIPEPILFINCYLLFIIYYRRKLIFIK